MNAELKRLLASVGLLTGVLFAAPVFGDIKDLLEMSEKLDKIEKQDFGEAIDKANTCTRARDFSCTNSWLAKATKLANGSRDKQVLAAAQQNMANEKARIAEEERQRAEEQRRIAEAEERLRIAEAEAARRANESSGPSTTMQLLQMGTAIMSNMAAEKARIAAAAANSTRSSSGGLPLADLSSERRAIEKARADAAAAQRAREQANATRLAAANVSSSAAAVRAAPQSTPTAASSFQAPQVFTSTERTSCPPGMSPVPSASGTACVVASPSNAPAQRQPAYTAPQTADRREQTIASRVAAANTPSVYPTPQPTIEPFRENCPPGYKPATHPNGVPMTAPAGGYCVKDPSSRAADSESTANRQGNGSTVANAGQNPTQGAEGKGSSRPTPVSTTSPTSPTLPKTPGSSLNRNDPTNGQQPTGEDAMQCITATQLKDDVRLTNNCSEKIYYFYCGDLKYTRDRCGDGSKKGTRGGFYTHGSNLDPGGSETTIHLIPNGTYRYGACKGRVGFTLDGKIRDGAEGQYTCLSR
jgi:hypothetical protein